MAVRAPHLYSSLRCFCLGAFKALSAELDSGVDLKKVGSRSLVDYCQVQSTAGAPAPG